MKVSDSAKLINNYQRRTQQIEQKQHLDAVIKKQQLEAERIKAEQIRAERIDKDRNNQIKGSNVDVSV